MKKLIFPLLVLPLVVMFASCNMNPAPVGGDTSRDGGNSGNGNGGNGGSSRELKKYVTLRLADSDGYISGSIGIGLGNTVAEANKSAKSPRADSLSESRALTYDNAVASHDFFEVVFIYGSPGSQTIARAAWDIGDNPQLRGVHRTGGGINYGFVSPSAVTNPATEGAAVLFVGLKEDKTLFALGRLVDTELPNGSTGTSIIYDDTISVTFEVAAIKAGVAPNQERLPNSSFRTYKNYSGGALSEDATVVEDNIYIHYVDKKIFPLFRLEGPDTDNVRYGAYTFELEASAAPDPSPNFNNYAAGIVLAGDRRYESRNPRYQITSGLYQYSTFLEQDLSIWDRGHLGMENNPRLLTDSNFQNPVVFKIDTSASIEGSVFAIAFEIYVYNLTSAASSPLQPGNIPSMFPDPVKWRISPGYGTYWLDLDDGLSGSGGAIFMGTGDVRARLPGFPHPTPPNP